MAHEYKTIELSCEDGVGILTMNRPQVLNSLNDLQMMEMREALALVNEDPAYRALILTGRGKGFCAGADLAPTDQIVHDPALSTGGNVGLRMEKLFNPLASDLFHLQKPLITAINGVAAGGGVSMALCGDISLAARSARFKLTFAPALGIVPDMGGTYLLPRLLGRARALGLAMLGESLSAEDAERWGLIWKCVDNETLMDEAHAIAGRMAEGPIEIFPKLRAAFALSESNTFDEQLDFERQTQAELCDGPNFKEGVLAFVQKRKPDFRKS